MRLLADAFFASSAVSLGVQLFVHAIGGPSIEPGEITFTVFILTVFGLVYLHSWTMIRLAWKEKRWKWISLLAGTGYASFYIFATNMVSAPDPGEPPPPPFGFLVASKVYGPMALWPDIEFWSPRLGLFGYFSVGSVLLVATLGLLASFAVALLIQSVRSRGERGPGKSAIGAYGSSFVLSLATNTCCCCAPILFPLVAALAGAGTADSLQFTLGPGTVFSDLSAVANIALLLTGILISTRKTRTRARGHPENAAARKARQETDPTLHVSSKGASAIWVPLDMMQGG